ncbi:MAG: hypothetical protein Q8K12_14640 [Thiobacillus sp.]|nr:hypothetical protein [Thiobacillus sp.]
MKPAQWKHIESVKHLAGKVQTVAGLEYLARVSEREAGWLFAASAAFFTPGKSSRD